MLLDQRRSKWLSSEAHTRKFLDLLELLEHTEWQSSCSSRLAKANYHQANYWTGWAGKRANKSESENWSQEAPFHLNFRFPSVNRSITNYHREPPFKVVSHDSWLLRRVGREVAYRALAKVEGARLNKTLFNNGALRRKCGGENYFGTGVWAKVLGVSIPRWDRRSTVRTD